MYQFCYQLLSGGSIFESQDFDDLETGLDEEICDIVRRFSGWNVSGVKILARLHDPLQVTSGDLLFCKPLQKLEIVKLSFNSCLKTIKCYLFITIYTGITF